MAFGGVAYYWSLLRPGFSVAQNFDALFFGIFTELRDDEVGNIRQRVEGLSAAYKHRKAVQTVMVTSYGLKANKHAGEIQHVVTADDLFG